MQYRITATTDGKYVGTSFSDEDISDDAIVFTDGFQMNIERLRTKRIGSRIKIYCSNYIIEAEAI